MSFSEEKRNNSDQLENLTEFYYLWVRVGFPLAIAITVVNSIALAVFLKKSFLVKKSTYLLVNLTITDLLVGVSVIATNGVILAVSFSRQPQTLTKLTLIFGSLASLFSNASISSLSLIAIERVFAVFWPFHHRLAESTHYFIAIAVSWVLTVCGSARIIAIIFERLKFFYGLLGWLVVLPLLSLSTILASYISIWIKLKFFTKFRRCRTIQENSKLTKTLFIVTLVSLVTWLPISIVHIMLSINGYEALFESKNIVVMTLLLMNSLFNVIVYSFRMPEFRKELRDMFCKCTN